MKLRRQKYPWFCRIPDCGRTTARGICLFDACQRSKTPDFFQVMPTMRFIFNMTTFQKKRKPKSTPRIKYSILGSEIPFIVFLTEFSCRVSVRIYLHIILRSQFVPLKLRRKRKLHSEAIFLLLYYSFTFTLL